MWTLTGFADEVATDFAEQLKLLSALGMRFLDLRSAWGVNVLRLNASQLDEAKRMVDAAGIRVSSIGSPIGKIPITGDFDRHLALMEHCASVAEHFETSNIRLFSFFIPEGDDPDQHRDEVVRRMTAIAAVAERHGLMALHENEKDIFGDVPRRCVDVIDSVGSDHLRHIIDPANYVQCGVKPFTEAYPMVRPKLAFMHIKDAAFATGEVRAAGEGEGEVREVVRALRDDGFDGFFSLEPHLGDFDAFGGKCGPELWTKAHTAFTTMLREEGVDFQ